MAEPVTSVIREVIIDASLEAVWDALVIEEKRNQWETRACSIDLKLGGKVFFDYGWGVTYSGEITELEPLNRLVTKNSEGDLTIWTLTEVANGIKVSIEYTGLWSGDLGHMMLENMAFGTTLFLKNFKSVLENNSDSRHTYWRSWLGITHTSIRAEHADKYPVSHGTLILQVSQSGSAHDLLFPEDIIVAANGHHIHSYDELEALLITLNPEELIHLNIIRQGKELQTEIKVGYFPVAYTA